jgi:hypothetical protein
MVVVPLITSDLPRLRIFAGGCVIHFMIQHDQGYRSHISYSPGKQIKKKKLIKKLSISAVVVVSFIISNLASLITCVRGV